MIKSYKTDYSNEIHQLVVSVSKHYFGTRQGIFKYQKKSFDVNLEHIENSNKTHMVHYLLRDHFSGLFYVEICTSDSLIPIYEFLFRAWSKKSYHPLFGMPYFLTIPQNVQAKFPELSSFVERIGINIIKVTSGFQGGVRDIRTWEDELKLCGIDFDDPFKVSEDQTIRQVIEKVPGILGRLFESPYRMSSKKEIWLSGIGSEQEIYVPKSIEDFRKIYYDTQHGAQLDGH